MDILEKLQRWITKIIKGMVHFSSWEGLRVAVFSIILCLAWRSCKVDHIYVHIHLEGGCKSDRTRLFSVMPSETTRDNGHKLGQKRLSKHKEVLFYCGGD